MTHPTSLLSGCPINGVFLAELAEVVQEGLAFRINNLHLLLLFDAAFLAADHRHLADPEAFLSLALLKPRDLLLLRDSSLLC